MDCTECPEPREVGELERINHACRKCKEVDEYA